MFVGDVQIDDNQNRACGILFAVFQTGAHSNGGVESVTWLIEGMASWRLTVVTNMESPVCERWRRVGAKVIIWKLPYHMGEGFTTGGLAMIVRRLASYVQTNFHIWLLARNAQFSLLHCNDPAPFWHVVPAARFAGSKVILNLRDTKDSSEGLDTVRYRRRFAWCDCVLVLSREMKEFYGTVYKNKKRMMEGETTGVKACIGKSARLAKERTVTIEYIYSAVNFQRMHPINASQQQAVRQRLGIGAEEFAVGFIATFCAKKNQLDYIEEVVPRLKHVLPQARTSFVGDFEPDINPYAKKCKDLVARLTLAAQVRFVGFTSNIESWYQACDVIIVPTRKEGLARCMIEALACGTPVISFDVCSAREILVDRDCGIVVRQGDYPALVRAVVALAEDSEERVRLGHKGRQVAETLFESVASTTRYQQICERLLKGGGESPTRFTGEI